MVVCCHKCGTWNISSLVGRRRAMLYQEGISQSAEIHQLGDTAELANIVDVVYGRSLSRIRNLVGIRLQDHTSLISGVHIAVVTSRRG